MSLMYWTQLLNQRQELAAAAESMRSRTAPDDASSYGVEVMEEEEQMTRWCDEPQLWTPDTWRGADGKL